MADSTDISPADAVRSIWEKHRESAFGRVVLIERAITQLTVAGLDEDLRERAERAAHMLAGSTGTFGFTRASQAAHALEGELAAPTQAQVPRLAELVMEVRHDIEREIATPAAQPVEPDGERPPLLDADGHARVLIVDDDPSVLEMMRELLERHDLEISTLADPLLFWEKLMEVAPELVILDVDMPGVNGPELCRVLREDPRWSGLAVIFVTAAGDPATIEELFRIGADDYLPKPIVGPELVTRVFNRLRRIRHYRAQAETDSLTGLPNRAKSSDGLTRLLALADRFSQALSVAMLDLDHFKQINDTHGHAGGDSVLRALGERLRCDFRGDDVIGRWGGEELVVGMYGMSGEDGVRRLTDTLARFSQEKFTAGQDVFRASFSAGVAEYPVDGQDLDGLLEAADSALYGAKAAGRARVLAAGHEAYTELCDVLCVEDDEMQAELLLSSLATRGYSTRHLPDGEQARIALCGSPPALRCRVLLLDVDLPGLDGHSLLRQLAQKDLLRSMRVIMLTARASEPETLEALELGAFDHVAKPFSLPVLLHRVKNAIET